MQGRAILASVVLFAVATFTGSARAETEYDISVSGGKVVVSAHAPWHINQEFHWKLKAGGDKLPNWVLSETSATFANPPKGASTVKGAMCKSDGDQKACKVIEVDITVP